MRYKDISRISNSMLCDLIWYPRYPNLIGLIYYCHWIVILLLRRDGKCQAHIVDASIFVSQALYCIVTTWHALSFQTIKHVIWNADNQYAVQFLTNKHISVSTIFITTFAIFSILSRSLQKCSMYFSNFLESSL